MWGRVGATVEKIVRPGNHSAKRGALEDIISRGKVLAGLATREDFKAFLAVVRGRRDDAVNVLLSGGAGKEEFDALRSKAKTLDDVLKIVDEAIAACEAAAKSLGEL